MGKSGNRYDMDHLNSEQPKSIVTQQDHKGLIDTKLAKNVSVSGSALLVLTKQLQTFDLDAFNKP